MVVMKYECTTVLSTLMVQNEDSDPAHDGALLKPIAHQKRRDPRLPRMRLVCDSAVTEAISRARAWRF